MNTNSAVATNSVAGSNAAKNVKQDISSGNVDISINGVTTKKLNTNSDEKNRNSNQHNKSMNSSSSNMNNSNSSGNNGSINNKSSRNTNTPSNSNNNNNSNSVNRRNNSSYNSHPSKMKHAPQTAKDDNPTATNATSTATTLTATPIPKQLAALRHAIAHPQQQVVLTCYIPPHRIGAVIGRKGSSILNIQREAARRSINHPGIVRVSVVGTNSTTTAINAGDEKTDDDASPALWTPVIIRADPVACFAAASLLLPLVENEMDDVVLEIPIHRTRHASIIGKRGLTIACLSADHGVRIMVPHKNAEEQAMSNNTSTGTADDKAASNNHTTSTTVANVQLEGELENVQACLVKLLAIVAPHSAAAAAAKGVNVGSMTNVRVKPMDSSDSTPHAATSTVSNSSNSEAIVTAPTEALVPSLARLRQIGKRTSTIIRRKKVVIETIATTSISPLPKATNVSDVEDLEDDETINSNIEYQTQFIISGKESCVRAAVSLFRRLFSGESVDSVVDNAVSGTATAASAAVIIPAGSSAPGTASAPSAGANTAPPLPVKNTKSEAGRGGRGRGRGRGRGGRGRGRGRGRTTNNTSSNNASSTPAPAVKQ